MCVVQARFQQEQQCQQLQQQAAALSGKVHALTGRCEGAESDAQALQRRVGLEAERVSVLLMIKSPPLPSCLLLHVLKMIMHF